MAYLMFTGLAVVAGIAAIMMDVVQVPLPHPATNHVIEEIHKDYIPIQGAPLTGIYAPNTALQSAKKYLVGVIEGAESIAFASDGKTLYLPNKFGAVMQATVSEDDEGVLDVQMDKDNRVFADLGKGRPLGAQVDANGDIVLCDTKGLLKVDSETKQTIVLTTRADDGSQIAHPNDLDIGKDSTIYFSDSTTIPVHMGKEGFFDSFRTSYLTLCHGKPTGRLLSFNPETKATKVLFSNLWYANGVAVSHDESFVLVVETFGLKVHKVYLSGPKSGTAEVLIDNLPGFPDGISRASDGNFWLSIVGRISPIGRFLHYKPVRAFMAYAPSFLRPKLEKWGVVLKISGEGEVVQKLMDPEGGFISSVASVYEHDGHLFLGNLEGDYISAFDLALLKKQ